MREIVNNKDERASKLGYLAGAAGGFTEVFNNIKEPIFANIVNPLLALLFSAALGYFLWGVVRFIRQAENPEGRESGKRHMIAGIIGLAIMLSAFGLIKFVFNVVTDPDSSGTRPKGINGEDIPTPSIIEKQSF